MKNQIFLLLLLALVGCENQPIEFPDYDYQSVYFPLQTPLRTLSLGEDRVDNSLDKEGKFDIGVSIGGLYKNNNDWTVDYVVDEELAQNVYRTNTDEEIQALPSSYYSLEPQNSVTIPNGSFQGLIRVSLNEAFFNDTLALTGQYVIPLRITNTTADTILQGNSSLDHPDRRVSTDWKVKQAPKDWVLFGIKYVNAFEGTYLHRGKVVKKDKVTGEVVDTEVFRNLHVEKDALIRMKSVSKTAVETDGAGFITSDDYSMKLTFDNDTGKSGSVTVSSGKNSQIQISGTGQYFDKASSSEQWSLLTWQSMYLDYSYEEGDFIHEVKDTLVFRDRGIHFEENDIYVGE
ncbi:BT_3987 domain-containing protein [Membranihabitans marinus]|uniref:BT_3987 domain-containing protein n=1 Tax=Membranihabitans marinus TaxID=1227546 RepID=UPI001F168A42|nr:DUF1735 domain-containing protein [Membranihabitans marinus]